MIGTSGFIGSKKDWLYAASHSGYGPNALEVNTSFYRTPSLKTIGSLSSLPGRPTFVFKVHKGITHLRRLANSTEQWDQFYASILPLVKEGRVGCVLFQMPPTYALSDKNITNLRTLAAYIGNSVNCAIEFRNRSWLTEEVYAVCKEFGWCVVSTHITKRFDNGKWMGTMPSGLFVAPRTAEFTYVRIHGKKGFRGALSKQQMEEIMALLRKRKGDSHYVMFNNVFYDNRVRNEVKMPGIRYAAISDSMRMSTRYHCLGLCKSL